MNYYVWRLCINLFRFQLPVVIVARGIQFPMLILEFEIFHKAIRLFKN